ncbi:hypothetical protein CROQUDRAFT_91133 [Cronartium quercuum f. sp. fusiforme G11]|uniref:Uncharacterized protein n=1 Tax=Cronartium quercuum f. sp. fusiforme G11 TaxID=708437 RepID=A0A9P6NIV1_9BASI|nr:hypothetical protein CROQUDRAFT_91133 [Cronartium quercuum f. sp. fusiforme G11]
MSRVSTDFLSLETLDVLPTPNIPGSAVDALINQILNQPADCYPALCSLCPACC